MPSNVLATRLEELQEAGVLRRVPHSRVIVDELTPYGRELEPVVLALGTWGFKAMGDPREEQVITPDSMTMALRTAVPAAGGRGPAAHRVRRAPGSGRAPRQRRGSGPRGGPWDGPADLSFVAGPEIRRIISGEMTPRRAIATDVVEVLHGRDDLLDRFAATFHLAA
ncbi:MAG: winged helix-turn-helix transcriptional regulator [Janthinobacterium lividum]